MCDAASVEVTSIALSSVSPGEGEGEREGDKGRVVGGDDGIGRINAVSRDVPARRGRWDKVCVLAKRREVQRQW